jgi:hypothetical protein
MPPRQAKLEDMFEPGENDVAALREEQMRDDERAGVEVLAHRAMRILRANPNSGIYYKGGELLDVHIFPDGEIKKRPMTKPLLVSHLRRYPDLNFSDKNYSNVATHILNHSRIERFPVLNEIHQRPVLRPNFTLVPPGYDEETGILYVPSALIDNHRFNTDAGPTDARKAYKMLLYPFLDFPIEAEPDRVNVIAFVLTLVARTALDCKCPVLAIDAAGQSSGKTLLADTIAYISQGKTEKWVSMDKGLNEVEKGIRTALVGQDKLAGVDNIVGVFRSPFFASIVTSEEPTIRIFGTLNRVSVPARCNFVLNGNNLKFDTDIAKRIIWTKMFHENPAERDEQQFRVWHDHGMSLVPYLKANWFQYYDAAMTIIQAWRNAGMPKRKPNSSLDKYRDWERTIGGMLEFVGVKTFLANHADRIMEADEEKQEIVRFMELVLGRFPDARVLSRGVPIDAIAKLLHGEWKGVLPEVSAESIESTRISLGKFITKKEGVVIHGYKMAKKRKSDGTNLVIRPLSSL